RSSPAQSAVAPACSLYGTRRDPSQSPVARQSKIPTFILPFSLFVFVGTGTASSSTASGASSSALPFLLFATGTLPRPSWEIWGSTATKSNSSWLLVELSSWRASATPHTPHASKTTANIAIRIS
ncbi:unnamed protein product, partial [Heterosigma akashiwo]